MAHALAFTAAEAAFVLREPVKTVKKALDDGPIESKLVIKASGTVRAVEWSDLLYLFAVRSLRDELTPKARNEFYHALKSLPLDSTREVRFGRLSVAVDDLRAEVEARTRDLAELSKKIEFRKDGEAVLKGTDVEVYRIAALLAGGLSLNAVCKDYPSLRREQVDIARAYAEVHPKIGRPYPRTTAKRALRGAGLEALDEVLNPET